MKQQLKIQTFEPLLLFPSHVQNRLLCAIQMHFVRQNDQSTSDLPGHTFPGRTRPARLRTAVNVNPLPQNNPTNLLRCVKLPTQHRVVFVSSAWKSKRSRNGLSPNALAPEPCRYIEVGIGFTTKCLPPGPPARQWLPRGGVPILPAALPQ